MEKMILIEISCGTCTYYKPAELKEGLYICNQSDNKPCGKWQAHCLDVKKSLDRAKMEE